jgi:hypothetical protein
VKIDMSVPNSSTDYYEVLQVSPSASPEVIEAAYRGLMRKYGEDPNPAVRELRRHVEAAFAVLSDAQKRSAYDAARNGAGESPAPPAEPGLYSFRPATVVECPRDPGVETALRCSRCERPICPRCLIQSPVGARCRDCARMVKSPVYTLSSASIARAAGASMIGGVVMGLIWGLVLLPFTFGFFSIFLGAGLGYAFTRALEVATGRKRGPVVVSFAIAGICVAWGMTLLFIPMRVALYGLVAAGIAAYLAYQNLR